MKLQIILAICAIVIFVLSSVFSAVITFLYDVNTAFIFYFLFFQAAVVFIVSAVFLKKYHDTVMNTVKRALKGDFSYNSDMESDKNFLELMNEIKDIEKKNKLKIFFSNDTIEKYIKDMKEVLRVVEKNREIIDAIDSDVRNLRNFFSVSSKLFDKIKAIGLEIKTTSRSIDEATQSVLKDAKAQSTLAAKGVKAIGHEIRGINELKQSILSSTKLIEELMHMSNDIKKFVGKIADMAKKTNLLALNAGIEAARAGEAGKSFSVVATEIKDLSSNSNQSAADIAEILKTIQDRTKEVIEIIKMTEKIEENIKTFYETGDIFIQIVKDVKHVEQVISTVTSHTEDHFTDSELLFKIITDNIKKIDQYNKIVDDISVQSDEINRHSITAYTGAEKMISSLEAMLEMNAEIQREEDGK